MVNTLFNIFLVNCNGFMYYQRAYQANILSMLKSTLLVSIRSRSVIFSVLCSLHTQYKGIRMDNYTQQSIHTQQRQYVPPENCIIEAQNMRCIKNRRVSSKQRGKRHTRNKSDIIKPSSKNLLLTRSETKTGASS